MLLFQSWLTFKGNLNFEREMLPSTWILFPAVEESFDRRRGRERESSAREMNYLTFGYTYHSTVSSRLSIFSSAAGCSTSRIKGMTSSMRRERERELLVLVRRDREVVAGSLTEMERENRVKSISKRRSVIEPFTPDRRRTDNARRTAFEL